MRPTRILRFPGPVVAFGVVLLMLGGLGLLGSVVIGGVTLKSTASTHEDLLATRKAAAARELRQAGVPEVAITEFFETGSISDINLGVGPDPRDRERVREILRTYESGTAASTAGTAIASGIGLGAAAIAGAVSLPLLLVGALLLLRRSVWRCEACGFVFDRA